MAGIAFSYLRFSTPEQASGDSRRRQLAMAEKYAIDHHLRRCASIALAGWMSPWQQGWQSCEKLPERSM
jgi:hypothetical protein